MKRKTRVAHRGACKVPTHEYAAGFSSSSPLFPSCLPRAAKRYVAQVFVSSVLSILSIQKLRKRPLNGGLDGWAAQLCFSNVSCATRLKASTATVVSQRGAVMPHGQWEQDQPAKSSSSTQIKRLLIHLLPFAFGIGARRRRTEHIERASAEG